MGSVFQAKTVLPTNQLVKDINAMDASPQKQKLLGLHQQAATVHSLIETEVKKSVPPDSEAERNKNAVLVQKIGALSTILIKLGTQTPRDIELPKAQWKPPPSDAQSRTARVEKLSWQDTGGGSPPASPSKVRGWNDLIRAGMTDHWVQMHLISEKLGGKGKPSNLTPGPKTVNSGMESYFEDPLKKLVSKSENKRQTPKVLWVSSSVNYRKGQIWAKAVKVRGGMYFYEGTKWKKDAKAKYSKDFPVPAPDIPDNMEFKPNLASDGRSKFLAIDVKGTGITGGQRDSAFTAANLQKIKDNGHYLGLGHFKSVIGDPEKVSFRYAATRSLVLQVVETLYRAKKLKITPG